LPSLLAVTPIDWARYRAVSAKAHGTYLASSAERLGA
jgi:hypothetical protein